MLMELGEMMEEERPWYHEIEQCCKDSTFPEEAEAEDRRAIWTNIYCKGGVDTPHNGVDTMLQALRQRMKKWSTSVDTRPGQVDTRDRSQRNMLTGFYLRSTPNAIRSTLESLPRRPVDTTQSQVDTRWLFQGTVLPSLGQCVDTPYGQVDTLRKLYDLRLEPSQRLQKSVLAARRVHLPAPALLVFPKANSHLSNDKKWRLINEEAVGSLQGSRSSGSHRLRRPQGRSQSSEYRASAWDFKNSSLFPIRSSTREYN
ncbi:hypothetical protein Taro_031958, partial [Colocasia esculenta]|nr:hypothetical protein [Colocasia esculenta]